MQDLDTHIQTRSEVTGIRNFPQIAEAMFAAKDDLTIWKISFNAANGDRVRLVRFQNTEWIFDPIL